MSTLGSASSPQAFSAFNSASRIADGSVGMICPATVVVPGGLLSKEKLVRHTLVITSRALYVFKGDDLASKEVARVPLAKLEAVLKSFDKDQRFTLAYTESVSAAFDSLKREEFCAELVATASSTKPVSTVTYEDKLIATLIASSKKTPWNVLLASKAKSKAPSRRTSATATQSGATQSGATDEEPNAAVGARMLRPQSIRTVARPGSALGMAGNEPASSFSGGARSGNTSGNTSPMVSPGLSVGGAASLGPMTLIWRRIEHTLKPHLELDLQLADPLGVLLVLECLGAVAGVPEGEVPFGDLSPTQPSVAARSVAAVLTDRAACSALASMLSHDKGSAFLVALEALLGCGDARVRRWAAVGLLEALPVFASAGVTPQTPVWTRAMLELAQSTPKRENPVLAVLFGGRAGADGDEPSSGQWMGDGLDAIMEPNSGGAGSGEPKTAGSSANSVLARPAQLRVVGKSTMSVVGYKSGGGGALSTAGRSGASLRDQSSATEAGGSGVVKPRQSLLSVSSVAAAEPIEGRLRAAFSLVWLSRLSDLENGVLDASTRDSGGVTNYDVQTLMQLLLGRHPTPLEADPEGDIVPVETFGASVEYAELIPSIVSALALTRDDAVRCAGLKQLNVLVMRNVPSVRAVLSVPDWQSTMLPILYSVPYFIEDRAQEHNDILSYALHFTSTLIVSTFGSRSQVHEFGPLDKIMAHTIYKVAVYGGWSEPTIDVTRMLFKGVLQIILKQCSSQQLAWRHDPSSDEWEELFRLCNLVQTFMFYRPELMCRSQVPAVFVDAMDAGIASRPRERTIKPAALGEWRTRITKPPVLCRIQPEKLVQLNRQLYSCMALPVMSPMHRGEDMGVHLGPDGLCADRGLVEVALALWTALGVTGIKVKDQVRTEEYTHKAEKQRIMYASRVCEELHDVMRLFDSIDNKVRDDKKVKPTPSSASSLPPSHAIDQVTSFFDKQKRTEVNVGFMSRRQPKSTAVKLRTNMLQQREFARRIGSHSATPDVKPQVTEAVPAPPSSGRTHGSRGAEQLVRNVNTVLTLRGDAITVPAAMGEEPTVFEQNASASLLPTRATVGGGGRRTLVKLEHAGPGSFTGSSAPEAKQPSFTPSPGESNAGSRKRSRNEACHGCDRQIADDTLEVLKFGFSWHAECLNCSNCHKNILAPAANMSSTKVEAHETYTKDEATLAGTRFYPVPELLLCSKECRMKVLANKADSRCPGCMDGFDKTETCLFACGRPWHKDIGCFRCTTCEVPFGATRDFFEHESEPYCKTCYRDTFLNCASLTCKRALGNEPVVQAANGSLFHDACFKCSVCSTPFGADAVYYSGTGGLLFCLPHFLQRRSPPCSVCRRQIGSNPEDEPIIMAGLTFHKNCFNCHKCTRPLSAEADFGADDEPNEVHGQIYCPDCYASEYALKCHKCNKGIRGDVLHAGVGKYGEPINWHPACFSCDECALKLIDVPFFIVTLGEEAIVPLCHDHYKTRYLNMSCKGCGLAVRPRASKNPGSSAAPGTQDEYTAVMFDDGMYHAQCLKCHEEGCTVNLFDEQRQKAKFEVNVVNGVPYCAKHAETHQIKCFACSRGISESEPCNELMDWVFHDRSECFCCILCKGPFLADQALRKRANGPCHAVCPTKAAKEEATVFEAENRAAGVVGVPRKSVALNRMTGRKTKTGRAYRRQSSTAGVDQLVPL